MDAEKRGPFGSWLHGVREKKGEVSGESAKTIGVHRVTYLNWERGENKPAIGSLAGIAKWAGVEVGDVLGLV